jgi:uncharacterized protein YigA (DUF484 family)
MTAQFDSHSVALYLEDNPHFFDEYPELMTGLRLSSPPGGRTISLQERQAEVLREKIKLLELKLASLSRVARENDLIIEKFHQWVQTLLVARDPLSRPDTLLQAIREAFDVPNTSLRLWDTKTEYADAWFGVDAGSEVRAFADKLAQPYCGTDTSQHGVMWLEDAASIRSVAIIALRLHASPASFGLLVLGSPDPQRFSSELATDFLSRIGETASATLQGLLG